MIGKLWLHLVGIVFVFITLRNRKKGNGDIVHTNEELGNKVGFVTHLHMTAKL